MAKKTQTQEEPADGVLEATAKTMGKAAAKMVSAVAGAPQSDGSGNNQEQQPPKISSKVPKLTKKNKSRLPRREKKARQKAGAV
jgi:hypothetical protein